MRKRWKRTGEGDKEAVERNILVRDVETTCK
jgi:hypothetical protein